LESPFSFRNPWFSVSLGLTVALVGATALVGLVYLPLAQKDFRATSIWDAICSAAGVPRTPSASTVEPPRFTTSAVVVGSDTLDRSSSIAVGRGATLAQQCAICHGAGGVRNADFPTLVGQPVDVVSKELQDFRAGARTSSVMGPFAAALTDQNIGDLAAYFAYLPRVPSETNGEVLAAPRIVANGAPMRNVPPCGSCHGALDTKAGAPWLDGQSATYVKVQLQAFANGTRHNDISGQMRNVAHRMTPEEMDEAARYFASQP
jgi:cytochrome c553